MRQSNNIMKSHLSIGHSINEHLMIICTIILCPTETSGVHENRDSDYLGVWANASNGD